jgi:hypothetical protein
MKTGISKSVSRRRYIITEPLAKGTCTIHFKSTLICPDPACSDPNFALVVKYTIIAE